MWASVLSPDAGRLVPSLLRPRRDRLDLDQLLGVAEERDAEQRARRSAQPRRDDVPDADEVGPLLCDDVDRRLQQRLDADVDLGERREQVVDRSRRLRLAVAWRDDVAVLVERARARREYEAVRRAAVLVRC